jgi:hypothetical protein
MDNQILPPTPDSSESTAREVSLDEALDKSMKAAMEYEAWMWGTQERAGQAIEEGRFDYAAFTEYLIDKPFFVGDLQVALIHYSDLGLNPDPEDIYDWFSGLWIEHDILDSRGINLFISALEAGTPATPASQ